MMRTSHVLFVLGLVALLMGCAPAPASIPTATPLPTYTPYPTYTPAPTATLPPVATPTNIPVVFVPDPPTYVLEFGTCHGQDWVACRPSWTEGLAWRQVPESIGYSKKPAPLSPYMYCKLYVVRFVDDIPTLVLVDQQEETEFYETVACSAGH